MEQRRTRRFALQLPVAIANKGDVSRAASGLTCNISSCGVLFTAPKAPDLGAAIEYMITLGEQQGCRVLVHCVGKVVRFEALRDEPPEYSIAATLERYEFVRAN